MKSAAFRTLGSLLIVGLMAGAFGCSAKNSPDSSFKEYRKMLERQKQKASFEQREEAAKKVPEMNAEGYERLGDQYLSQGDINMAFMQYSKALGLEPAQPRTRYKIGRLFLEKELLEDAKREFEIILKANSKYALAYEGLGRVALKKKELYEAEQNFQQAIRLNANLWQAYNCLGIIYDRQSRFEKAIAQYTTAITLEPNVGLLYNNLGTSLLLAGEYEKSIRAFTEALKREPSNRQTCNNLALASYKLGRYSEALEALKKGGDEASAYNNLGCLYMADHRYKEAMDAFERAMRIKPGFYDTAHENMKKAKTGLKPVSFQ